MPKHIVIVGGGIAGLTCIRELTKKMVVDEDKEKSSLAHAAKGLRITLVEASDRLGGRIRFDDSFGDLGAEFSHGRDTVLTNLFEELRKEKGLWSDLEEEFWEEIFITSHADGGPAPHPTKEGKYGVYYVGGKLVRYDDPLLQPLNEALEEIDADEEVSDRFASVGSALDSRKPPLSPELYALAEASYGNTAGCTNLHDLSHTMLKRFEEHWSQNETEGDLRPPASVGMYGIVKALLEDFVTMPHVEIKCGWKVDSIRDADGQARIVSDDGQVLAADAVVVTVPPTILPQIMELTDTKLEALQYVGFERAIKVCLKLSEPCWPEKVQSMACADTVIPEMWFRTKTMEGKTEHMAVAYLVSGAADKFIDRVSVNGEPSLEVAKGLVLDQLALVFDVPRDSLSCYDAMMYDWKTHPTIKGGYMYAKVGLTPQHLEALASPMGRLFFAGEATNTNACCTVQAAMETAIRASNEVSTFLAESCASPKSVADCSLRPNMQPSRGSKAEAIESNHVDFAARA